MNRWKTKASSIRGGRAELARRNIQLDDIRDGLGCSMNKRREEEFGTEYATGQEASADHEGSET